MVDRNAVEVAQLNGLSLQLGEPCQGVGEAGPGEHGEGPLPADLPVGGGCGGAVLVDGVGGTDVTALGPAVAGDGAGCQAQHGTEQVCAEQVRFGQGGAERFLHKVVHGVAVASVHAGVDVAGQHVGGAAVQLVEGVAVAAVQAALQVTVGGEGGGGAAVRVCGRHRVSPSHGVVREPGHGRMAVPGVRGCAGGRATAKSCGTR